MQLPGIDFMFSIHTTFMRRIKDLPINFFKCGVTGWCLEVMFTSMESILARDWRLIGRTSLLWYGSVAGAHQYYGRSLDW